MKLADRLAGKAVDVGAIKRDDVEVYTYSYRMLFFNILLWATAIAVGIITNQLLGILLFMAFFVPLRQYAGGIHVQSQIMCYFITAGIFLLVCLGPHLQVYSQLCFSMAVLAPIAIVLMFLFAPQEDPNKPASANEYRHFRKMTRIILIAEIAIILVLIWSPVVTKFLYFPLAAIHTGTILVMSNVIKKRLDKAKGPADSQ